MHCRITVRGPLGPLGRAALEGFEVVGSTQSAVRLEGDVIDEAALHGMLHRLQGLQIDLLQFVRVEEDDSPAVGDDAD